MMSRHDVELESYSRLPDRFWSKVDRSGGPDACWPWTIGCNPGGYGNFQMRRRGKHYTFQASRWVLGMLRGEPLRWDAEKREEACHRCDNPPCCNPAHLYVGTHAENLAEAGERGRFVLERNPSAQKTHCPAGHPYSGDNLKVDTKRNRRICRTCRLETYRRYRANRAKRRTGHTS